MKQHAKGATESRNARYLDNHQFDLSWGEHFPVEKFTERRLLLLLRDPVHRAISNFLFWKTRDFMQDNEKCLRATLKDWITWRDNSNAARDDGYGGVRWLAGAVDCAVPRSV